MTKSHPHDLEFWKTHINLVSLLISLIFPSINNHPLINDLRHPMILFPQMILPHNWSLDYWIIFSFPNDPNLITNLDFPGCINTFHLRPDSSQWGSFSQWEWFSKKSKSLHLKNTLLFCSQKKLLPSQSFITIIHCSLATGNNKLHFQCWG